VLREKHATLQVQIEVDGQQEIQNVGDDAFGILQGAAGQQRRCVPLTVVVDHYWPRFVGRHVGELWRTRPPVFERIFPELAGKIGASELKEGGRAGEKNDLRA